METVPLRDILINARQESVRMRHYYLGVEHVFIALLEIPGGLTASVLEEHGFPPRYVIDALRRKIGKGGENRLWAGMPNSPRLDIVLSIANDLALEQGHEEINERDLLIAIFEEGDAMLIHVLRALALNIDSLAEAARTRVVLRVGSRPYISIMFGSDYDGGDVSDQQLFILRRMFDGYGALRIERRLTGGFTDALLLVVTPVHADGLEDAPVVIKLDNADTILDEAKRYEQYVKGTLPPLTARIEDKPTAPETSTLAGLKYTLVTDNGVFPQDLRRVARDWGAAKLGEWLRGQLYPYFGRTWWSQRRPFRFQGWMEYDWLLPPVLTLDYLEADAAPPDAPMLKDPIRRTKLVQLEPGDVVVLEGFTVQKVLRERKRLQLASGHGTEAARRAFKIELRDVNLAQNTFYRGEVVDRLVGRVYKTRDEILRIAARALKPPFDVQDDFIPGFAPDDKLPNPLRMYGALLEQYVNGSLCKIHGDLHLGNVVVGPGTSPFLIDFAQARDGHTLSDWAMLEISILSELVVPEAGDGWDAAYALVRALSGLGGTDTGHSPLATHLRAVQAVRAIAADCLHVPGAWTEYFVALTFCALRAVTWDTMPLASRRVMFLVSALAVREVQRREHTNRGAETQPDLDLTDTRFESD